MKFLSTKKKCIKIAALALVLTGLLALVPILAHDACADVYHSMKRAWFDLNRVSLAKRLTEEYDICVAFLSCDEDALYDYETGIFVTGISYDIWAELYGEEEAIYHSNYFQRSTAWVREASIELYDALGTLTLDQDIGIAVSGGASSIGSVKSLKIIADEAYDQEADKFSLYLENGDVTTRSYSGVTEYNSLRLRIGDQDAKDANIRSALVSRLAATAGFDGMTSTTRLAVYLNGAFCAIYDIQQTYSVSYLADRFSLEDKELIEKSKGSELDSFYVRGLTDIFASDLSDEENYAILEAVVDMDNYLLCYAIQILCNNTDCVNNNFAMWRYTGEKIADNPYTDGRWRFLLYDMDLVYNTDERSLFFEGSNDDVFVQILENTNRQEGASLKNVLAYANYRDRFITLLCDLQNDAFTTEHILSIVEEEYEKISDVTAELCGAESKATLDTGVAEVKKAVESRPAEIAETLATYFDLTDTYTSTLTTTPGVAVTWSNMTVYGDDSYTCDYYAGVSRMLTAEAYPGYTFVGWEVDGEMLYAETIEITPTADCCIRAVAMTTSADTLILDAISAKGEEDWFTLYNAGTTDILISDYYVSDDAADLAKDQLPAITLSPGETITIYGSKSSAALTETSCSFALSDGETLYVSDVTGTILEQRYIPKMSTEEYYGRYDHSNTWLYHAVEATE